MLNMLKLTTILFISMSVFLQPSSVNAVGLTTTPSCESQNIKVTIDAPESNLLDQERILIGQGRIFGVNVKIPSDFADGGFQYYVVILSHPDLGTERATTYRPPFMDDRIQGSSPTKTENILGTQYNVYHWNFPTGVTKGPAMTSDYHEYIVELKHAEGVPLGAVGKDICLGPPTQIKTVDYALAAVESCPLTMSKNFNKSDGGVTGTVNLKKIDGISYGYRLDDGDILAKIPRGQLNPIPLSSMPGFNPLKGGGSGLHAHSAPLEPGTGIRLPLDMKSTGTYTATVYAASGTGKDLVFACGSRVITVSNRETEPQTTEGGTIVPPGGGGGINPSQLSPHQGAPVNPVSAEAKPCRDNDSIETAIGCIRTSPAGFTKDVLGFMLGIGGGLAFLMMLLGAFQMLTSAGNPDTLNAGRERLTSAIIGLLIIIFAVLLLQIIGVGILNIPGFTK